MYLRSTMAREWIVELDDWPLVVLHLDGAPDTPRLESFEEALDAVLTREARCGVVLDMTGAAPDAGRRRRTAMVVDQRRAAIERWVVAGALIVPSAFHRGVLTAMRWIFTAPLAIPWESFGTPEPARAFIRGQLAREARTAL